MTEQTFNDILQWGTVIAILIIVLWRIIRKFMRFNRQMKQGNTDCSCGCGSCPESNCTLKDLKSRK